MGLIKRIGEPSSDLPRAVVEQLHERLREANSGRPNYEPELDDSVQQDSVFSVAVTTELGALPDLDKLLEPDLRDIDSDDIASAEADLPEYYSSPGAGRTQRAIDVERTRRRGLSTLLDELLLGPARIVRDYLSTVTYIGPLREIPGRNYRPQLSPDESRWAQGLAAWDLLNNDQRGNLVEDVNQWLSSEEKLNTGYRLEKVAFREVPVPSGFDRLFQRGLEEDDLAELEELYRALIVRVRLRLRDVSGGTVVSPSDVGVGISQMVPVVVACIRHQAGLIAIEQPELHIHPAIQVGMGDLFIETTHGPKLAIGPEPTLLIETHSEHIMLRLLRRIRERTIGSLPPGAPELQAQDLSVIYVESSDGGGRFKNIRVDEDGDFIDRWPKGFFDERDEELF